MTHRLLNYLFAAYAICAFDLGAASLVTALTPEQAAGQFLGTTLAGLSRDEELDLWLGERAIAVVVLYRDDTQGAANARFRRTIERHARPGLRPLIALDQEGGTVVRYDPAWIPSAMALGAAGSEELAFRAGRHVGCSLRPLGVDIDFAPVLDLASPTDSGIGTRSFGSDPAAVGRLGASFVRGLASAGVLSVAKHFPGQGFADADPHFGPSASPRTRRQMSEEDLRPFREALAAGVAGVMTAHVAYPAWIGPGSAPASVSPAILRRVLRDELAFDGLVITDAIQMEGLGETVDTGELAVRAIESGADIILAPAPMERDEVYGAILAAIRSGRLSGSRVARTAARVRAARIASAEHAAAPPCAPDPGLAEEIARASVTRIGDASFRPAASFFTGPRGGVADRFPANRRHLFPEHPPLGPQQIEAAAAEIQACGTSRWVALVHNGAQAAFVRALRARLPEIPFTLIVAGTPFVAGGIETDDAIFSWGGRSESIRAVLEVLEQKQTAPGRLPVDVDGVGRMGEGETAWSVSSGARESP